MGTRYVIIFTFLLFQITTSSNITCIETERQSLLVFKRTLTNSYDRLSSWSGVECCGWQGVGCDSRNGHVLKLDLRSPAVHYSPIKPLGGHLSQSLQNLKYLRYLDLSMNYFSGNVPEFLGSFERLEYLNLSSSGFVGVVPRPLGNLSRLQYLDLSHCFYSLGDFGWVSSLTKLRYLDLSLNIIGNQTDLFHLGNLSRLQYLDLSNEFNSRLNDLGWVSSLTKLRYLDLSLNIIGNQTDWFHLGNLSRLQYLDLSDGHNSLDDLGWVSLLSALRYLDLSYNTIRNQTDWFHPVNMLPSLLTLNLESTDIISIPSVRSVNFTSLTSLDLSVNESNFTLPVWLSNLTGLMHLDLYANQFHGKIPDFIGNLSSLVRLDLSVNRFSGPIPSSLGLLTKLETLKLGDNQLSGNIPTSLGQLSELKHLDLSNNSLVGVLSESHFSMLKNLNHLMLSRNSLVGLNFSSQWIPPFQLQEFHADSCNIGPQFPKLLQTSRNLQLLDLYNSSIRDTIPEWFENILSHIVYMDLSNNQIRGKLPRIHFGNSSLSLDEEGILRMNSNKFEGSLATFPSNVTILDLSDNLLSGHVPQTDGIMNPNLILVNLSKNRFTGTFPLHLCKVLSIQVLDLSQNKFSGRIPRCLGNMTNLTGLDLTNNSMTGVVPSSLGSLKDLLSLHLQNNRLEGELPTSLQNLMNLQILDIGNNLFNGTIPFWIGKNLSILKLLDLHSNKFTGKIPLQLCQLEHLRYLSLANNNITGTIPGCLGNLRGMIQTPNYDSLESHFTYGEYILAMMKGRELLYTSTIQFLISLDLSGNNIVGEIPDALINLVGLKNLNLSGNNIKGQIPMMIGNLNELESLDLSLNKLSGRIPQSLTSLNSLSHLNMSFNNLSGPIPVGNQLQTLDDPSIYEGNNGLCGPQVSRNCNRDDVTYNHVGEDEGQHDSDDVWFYAGMGPGFLVGFMGLLGSLHFIRGWRLAYFETLEDVYAWVTLSFLLNLARLRRKVSNMVRI